MDEGLAEIRSCGWIGLMLIGPPRLPGVIMMNHADDAPAGRIRVERDFATSRQAAELLAAAYELLLPIDTRRPRPQPQAVAIPFRTRRLRGRPILARAQPETFP